MFKVLLLSAIFVIISATRDFTEAELERKLIQYISKRNSSEAGDIFEDVVQSKASNGSFTSQLSPRPPSGYPCNCGKGQCSCCTGSFLALIGQKACMNLTYEADDFAFTGALSVNEKVLYKNRISGKNPPPMCVRLPRLRAVKVCVRLSNIYFQGPNMHTCVDIEASYQDITMVDTAFDCIRLGVNGLQSLGPEEGGGAASLEEEDEDIEDYDDNA